MSFNNKIVRNYDDNKFKKTRIARAIFSHLLQQEQYSHCLPFSQSLEEC
jgi:hypothetical protein